MKTAGGTGRSKPEPQRMQAITVFVVCVAVLAGIGIWNGLMPRADSRGQPDTRPISTYTLVETGIVFVDPETSNIVWRNTDGDSLTIGENPWRNPGTAKPSTLTGAPAWRGHRELLGNPQHDLVSWVETVDGHRGNLVVVEASTGTVLARALILAPQESFVVLASVDDEALYFATPHPETGYPDMPGGVIWAWNWAAGNSPWTSGSARSSRYYNDVGAGIWAVYGRGVEFEGAERHTLTSVPFPEPERTDFGSSLSPDGRYWYGAGTSQVVDTATGSRVQLPVRGNHNYGWTGPTELTLTMPPMVCSAVTGSCRGPAGFPPGDVCLPYGLDCGDNLPVN